MARTKASGFRPGRVIATIDKDARPKFAGKVVGRPEDVHLAMAEYIGHRATEVFVVLFLDIRNGLVGFTEMTELSTHGVQINTAGILREALVSGAAGGITIHQHPTGDPTPSQEDRDLWRRLDAAGSLIGFPFVDHLVVTYNNSRYFSLRQEEPSPS